MNNDIIVRFQIIFQFSNILRIVYGVLVIIYLSLNF